MDILNMITVLMTVRLSYWRCFGGKEQAIAVFTYSYGVHDLS